mgnify:CR=1 FL=1|tara:strand:+ start:3690 stop:4664 length:975 start_codon:yes stop_codon:yes gene_type:complete
MPISKKNTKKNRKQLKGGSRASTFVSSAIKTDCKSDFSQLDYPQSKNIQSLYGLGYNTTGGGFKGGSPPTQYQNTLSQMSVGELQEIVDELLSKKREERRDEFINNYNETQLDDMLDELKKSISHYTELKESGISLNEKQKHIYKMILMEIVSVEDAINENREQAQEWDMPEQEDVGEFDEGTFQEGGQGPMVPDDFKANVNQEPVTSCGSKGGRVSNPTSVNVRGFPKYDIPSSNNPVYPQNGGSDWVASQYSRGPANTVDLKGEQHFRAFNQTAEYIPTEELKGGRKKRKSKRKKYKSKRKSKRKLNRKSNRKNKSRRNKRK